MFVLTLLFSIFYLIMVYRAARKGQIRVRGSAEIVRRETPILFKVVIGFFALCGLIMFGFSAWELIKWLIILFGPSQF